MPDGLRACTFIISYLELIGQDYDVAYIAWFNGTASTRTIAHTFLDSIAARLFVDRST